MCFHACYDRLTPAAMRAAAQYDSRAWADAGAAAARERWRARLTAFIDDRVSPHELRRGGVTAPLLAYCGIDLNYLVLPRGRSFFGRDSHYFLEHLLDVFGWRYDDLLLLGFDLKHFANARHYPLIVLHDRVAFGAAELFRFHMSFADLQRFFLDVDARYARLLQLNVPYWRSALTQGAAA